MHRAAGQWSREEGCDMVGRLVGTLCSARVGRVGTRGGWLDERIQTSEAMPCYLQVFGPMDVLPQNPP